MPDLISAHLHQDLLALALAHQQRRAVRATAQLGSLNTPLAWAGSQLRLLVFERGLSSYEHTASEAQAEEMQVDFFAFEELEALLRSYDPQEPARWLQAAHAHARLRGLPPNWLAQIVARQELTSAPAQMYDPAQVLGKLGRLWAALPAAAWQMVREQEVKQASALLASARAGSMRVDSVRVDSETGAISALLLARRVARETLLPALVGPRATPLSGWRLPHHWHAAFALSAPKAVALLDQLYGFGGSAEAARVLRAVRGLGMLGLEQRARVAVQAGYANGAVRLLRDEAARVHHQDIQRWAQLSPARRERLSLLLGLERSPLGAVALETAQELVQAVRLEAWPTDVSSG